MSINRQRFLARYVASLEIAAREPGKHTWFDIVAKTDEVTEIFIYDEIGYWGVSASDFIRDLKGVKSKSINLRLNTPGGMVTDGHAIFNALKDHPATVCTSNDALAASMGSILQLLGSPVFGGGGITMAKNALFMIHNPWGFAMGDSEEMMKTANLLDKMTGILADTYVEATGKTKEEILQAMKDESWYTAEEAKAMGFCTTISGENKEAAASVSVAMFDDVPEHVLKAIAENKAAIQNTVVDEPEPESEVKPNLIAFRKKQLELLELN